jgi:hypothetical protein
VQTKAVDANNALKAVERLEGSVVQWVEAAYRRGWQDACDEIGAAGASILISGEFTPGEALETLATRIVALHDNPPPIPRSKKP